MKHTNMVKYFSVLAIVLVIIAALLKTGGDGTSIMVTLISLVIIIAASMKIKNLEKK